MEFLYGIDVEASIYCNASKLGLASQRDYVSKVVKTWSSDMVSAKIEDWPYEKVITSISVWAEEAVKANGWDVCDEDGVSWFIALYCKSYLSSLLSPQKDYDTIFKDCFKKYFRDKSKTMKKLKYWKTNIGNHPSEYSLYAKYTNLDGCSIIKTDSVLQVFCNGKLMMDFSISKAEEDAFSVIYNVEGQEIRVVCINPELVAMLGDTISFCSTKKDGFAVHYNIIN